MTLAKADGLFQLSLGATSDEDIVTVLGEPQRTRSSNSGRAPSHHHLQTHWFLLVFICQAVDQSPRCNYDLKNQIGHPHSRNRPLSFTVQTLPSILRATWLIAWTYRNQHWSLYSSVTWKLDPCCLHNSRVSSSQRRECSRIHTTYSLPWLKSELSTDVVANPICFLSIAFLKVFYQLKYLLKDPGWRSSVSLTLGGGLGVLHWLTECQCTF